MQLRRREVLKVLAASAGATVLPSESLAKSGNSLERDVAIIGGGAAGAYAAVRLRDLGHSVAVIERANRIGGHTETFRDGVSGAVVEIGVYLFPDTDLVRAYFARFGVALATAPIRGLGPSKSVDFRTGLPVDAFAPTPMEVGGALVTYLQLVSTRFGFLAQNGYKLPPSGPVLDELLMPFGQFVKKYQLSALLPLFFLFEEGFGPLLNATTLYVLKNMGPSVVGSFLNQSFLHAPSGAGALYEGVRHLLGCDVLLESRVLRVERCEGERIRLAVHTQEGVHEIRARKLIVTAPPLLSNFAGFDLDVEEFSTFARFAPQHYYTGVARVDGLPAGMSLINSAPETPFNIPPLPALYLLSSTAAPGYLDVKYGSPRFLAPQSVQREVEADINRLNVPDIGPLAFDGFAAFKDHSPYCLQASAADIRRGFYRNLEALQGRNNTFYASAAFQTHNSAAIWAHVEELLPTIFA